jgi:hypothetical protein
LVGGPTFPIRGPILPVFNLHPMSKVFLQAAVFDLNQLTGTPTRANVLDVEGRYSDPDFGDGVARFADGVTAAQADPFVPVLAQTGQLPAFDYVCRKLSDADLTTFKTYVLTTIMAEDPSVRIADLTKFIITKRNEVAS